MRDVADDVRQQTSRGAWNIIAVKRGVTHAGADPNGVILDRNMVQFGKPVDVNEMRRTGHPKRHGRHQALPTGQNPAIAGTNVRKDLDCLPDRTWKMISKARRLHRSHASLAIRVGPFGMAGGSPCTLIGTVGGFSFARPQPLVKFDFPEGYQPQCRHRDRALLLTSAHCTKNGIPFFEDLDAGGHCSRVRSG
jgi:hypothetical protein